MSKYRVIRKCYYRNKKWNIGDVVELNEVPPPHFVLASDNDIVSRFIDIKTDDGIKMKSNNEEVLSKRKEISTLYEASIINSKMGVSAGFASTLGSSKPISNPKDLKLNRNGK
jgi:hypothetical protein